MVSNTFSSFINIFLLRPRRGFGSYQGYEASKLLFFFFVISTRKSENWHDASLLSSLFEKYDATQISCLEVFCGLSVAVRTEENHYIFVDFIVTFSGPEKLYKKKKMRFKCKKSCKKMFAKKRPGHLLNHSLKVP